MSVKDRYGCQVKLPQFDIAAQAKLKNARVLIVGLGGLGCPAAQYLASAGVGTIGLVDHDVVDRSNLHRQILFGDANIGESKAKAAATALKRQNPGVKINVRTDKVVSANVVKLIQTYDIIVDCTDNYEVRYVLNDSCVLADKPLVYGAAYQYQGQVAVWNAPNADGSRSPHYRDVFPDADMGLSVDCSQGGVLPTLTGIIGCMQANEVIKYIVGLPGLLVSKLLTFDSLNMQSHVFTLPSTSNTIIRSLPDPIPTITADELHRRYPSKVLFELVDVRSREEHDEFNIGGRLAPLETLTSGEVRLSFKKPTVFYCATGERSSTATRHFLNQFPDAQAWSLEGGIRSWQ